MSDKKRLLSVLNRLAETNEDELQLHELASVRDNARREGGGYQALLLESLLLLQLDAQEMLKNMLNPKIEIPTAEAIDRALKTFGIEGQGDLTEAAPPPDPHAVWPGHDIKRFVFTIDAVDAAASTADWRSLVASGLDYYSKYSVGHPSENFATNYGDIEISIHAHTVVLRATGAEEQPESNVGPRKCAAKPVEMALSMLQEIDGDTVSKARALLQAALAFKVDIDWLSVTDRPWSKDPDQRPISQRLSPDKYDGPEPAQLGAGFEIDWEEAKRSLAGRVPNDDEVICPHCAHQFRAIPVNVQKLQSTLESENEVAIRFLQQASAFLKAQHPLGLAPERLGKRIEEWLQTPSARHEKSGDELLGDDKAAMKREAAHNHPGGAWRYDCAGCAQLSAEAGKAMMESADKRKAEADEWAAGINPTRVVTVPLVSPTGFTIDMPIGKRFGAVPPEPRPCGCAMLETAQGLQCQRGGLLCRCQCHDPEFASQIEAQAAADRREAREETKRERIERIMRRHCETQTAAAERIYDLEQQLAAKS